MKSLSEYLLESEHKQTEVNNEEANLTESEEQVWVVTDKDLDGAILDVCETEEAAQEAYEGHMKENSGNNLEIKTCKRSEVEKKED